MLPDPAGRLDRRLPAVPGVAAAEFVVSLPIVCAAPLRFIDDISSHYVFERTAVQ
jgi:hypothetical protein